MSEHACNALREAELVAEIADSWEDEWIAKMAILARKYTGLSMSERGNAIREAELAGEIAGDSDAGCGGEPWTQDECTEEALASAYWYSNIYTVLSSPYFDFGRDQLETETSLHGDPRLAAWIRGWKNSAAMVQS